MLPMTAQLHTDHPGFPRATADHDPLVDCFRELDDKEALYCALVDERLSADDPHRLEKTRAWLAVDLELLTRRMETTPPASLQGMALLIRYALERTESPGAAAALRSCLVALVGEANPLVPVDDDVAPAGLPDEPMVLCLDDLLSDGCP